MVFPVGTLCTHAQESGQIEMKGKRCFGSLGSIWLFFFFFGSVVVFALFLACTCETCIASFVGSWCRCAKPELCVVQPCSVPSGTQLEPPAHGSAGGAAPRGCLCLGQGQLCWWQSHVLGTTCSPAVTTQFLQPGAGVVPGL